MSINVLAGERGDSEEHIEHAPVRTRFEGTALKTWEPHMLPHENVKPNIM